MTAQLLAETTPPKKAQIEKAASRLFRKFGVRRVSVEEVCREAKVSKATFYKYFSNKPDLARTIFDAMADRALERTEKILAKKLPFEEKARRLIDDKLAGAARLSEAFVSDFHEADADIRQFVENVTQRSHRTFIKFLAQAQDRGELPNDVKPEFILAVLEKLHELEGDPKMRAQFEAHVDLSRAIVDLLFYGLLGQRVATDD